MRLFRSGGIRATERIKEQIVKGFAMDDERLERRDEGACVEELLAPFRGIRSSEKAFRRKLLEMEACTVAEKFVSSWFYVSLEKHQDTFLSMPMGPVRIIAKCDDFAEALRNLHEDLDARGYDVVSVVPLSVGYADSFGPKDEAVSFSVTAGAVVVDKLRE